MTAPVIKLLDDKRFSMMGRKYYIWLVMLWAMVGGCVKDSTSSKPAPKTETNSQQSTESRGSTNGIGLTRMAEGQIPATLPKLAGSRDSNREKPIVIILKPFGKDNEKCRFFMEEKKVVDQAELEKLLGKAAGDDMKSRPIIISIDGTTRWKYAVEVFNTAVKMGFTKIGFKPYENSNDKK